MDSIAEKHKEIKALYDKGESPLNMLGQISSYCIEKLARETKSIEYNRSDEKEYIVFSDGKITSRPVRSSLFISCSSEFNHSWYHLIGRIDPSKVTIDLCDRLINRTIYTAIISIAACYDIWKNGSRKTPGTHFEILLGSIIHRFIPSFQRLKFIPLPGQTENVSTDIVFDNGQVGIVIPAKITTRERVVQPYAHQRILDSIFGHERYKSVLLCVSETQRDDKSLQVNDICVPGTLRLFQEHLSKLAGLYYLDPPTRYIAPDIQHLLPVNDYAHFLKFGLRDLTSPKKEKAGAC